MSAYQWAHDQGELVFDWTPNGGEEINFKVTRRVPVSDDLDAPLFFGEEILQRDLEPPLMSELKAMICGLMRRREPDKSQEWSGEQQFLLTEYAMKKQDARRKVGLRNTGATPRVRKTWP